VSEQVSKGDFDDFDYVLCMDESNLSDLKVSKEESFWKTTNNRVYM
jgi:protein-tyrosine-phosphatase